MKAAVAYLEQFMEKVEGAEKGKIVLATVKGDVHDIGKNLVDIILTNNGYKVYNLGIKQPIDAMIAEFQKHDADAIGMSGLLVKSTVIMKEDLVTLNERGLAPPVILGGAALNRRYVEEDLRAIYKGQLYYGEDAFDGPARSWTNSPPARSSSASAASALKGVVQSTRNVSATEARSVEPRTGDVVTKAGSAARSARTARPCRRRVAEPADGRRTSRCRRSSARGCAPTSTCARCSATSTS